MVRTISTLLVAAWLLSGCDTLGFSDGKQKPGTASPEQSIRIISPLPSTPADPVQIIQTTIAGDSLGITVRYGGGCETHEFQLVTDGSVMESFPPQVALRLLHNANNDRCKALETREVSFDIAPLKALAGNATGHGILILHLATPGSASLDGGTIRYEF